MRSLGVLSLFALALLTAGCLHEDGAETVTVRETVTETGATGTVPNTSPALVALYFLQERQVWPEQRGIQSRAVATTAIHQLFEGSQSGLETAIPAATRLRSLSIDGGTAAIRLEPPLTDRDAQAQIVYTLTQFPTVRRVSLNGGRPVTRSSYEEQTPSVLVESPLGGEEVEPGFEVTGTANTFEATFNYELRDAENRILTENFVTATSGSGTRGTFEFTVPYEVDRPQEGRLVVFEISAANGSRTHERSIPLSLR